MLPVLAIPAAVAVAVDATGTAPFAYLHAAHTATPSLVLLTAVVAFVAGSRAAPQGVLREGAFVTKYGEVIC